MESFGINRHEFIEMESILPPTQESVNALKKRKFYMKFILAFFVFCVIVLTFSVFLYKSYPAEKNYKSYQSNQLDENFQKFMKEFNKSYSTIEEYELRKAIWNKNSKFIENFNAQDKGSTLKINGFGDISNDEFRSQYLGYSRLFMNNLKWSEDIELNDNNFSLPSYVNWVERGCVTPVKDQGRCGSCWAFSTTGSIESAQCIKTNKLYSLSEQQLIDCDLDGNDAGCNGGTMDSAYKFVKKNQGLCQESDYPYEATDNICQENSCESVSPIKGFKRVRSGDIKDLKRSVAFHGPVSVALDGGDPSFRFYSGGILSAPCADILDHAVLVVGYGTDDAIGKDYWLVKNSWGQGWGLDGYIKIDINAGGPEGECGILLDAIYPVV